MHHKYSAPNGETWRIESAPELLAAFDLAPAAVPDWHRVMAGIGQAWECLCRHYAIYEILTTHDPARMLPADDAAIAKALGLKASHVADLLKQAGDYWRKHCRRDASAGTGVKSVAASALPPPMESAEIQRLLSHYGFRTSDETEQSAIARRCVELSSFLENDLLRSTAVSLINQERLLESVDESLRNMTPLEKATRAYLDRIDSRAKLQAKIEETQDRLGVWDTPETMRRKDAFSSCISALVEAVRVYRAEGSNDLIDGVFREGEVQVLLKDYDLRKPQYRPDLVLLTVPSAIEGLFDPDFKAPKLPRHVHRRLAKSFANSLAAARQEDGQDVDELDTDPEDFSDE